MTDFCQGRAWIELDRAAALEQSRAFYQTVKRMKELGHPIPKVHVLASGGLLHCPDIGGDYVRPGIALYGQMSTKEEWSKVKHELRPVLSLKARIALVKDLHRDEGAGYGHQFKAERDTKIAVASIGYADGLPRSLSNGVGTVLVHGHSSGHAWRYCCIHWDIRQPGNHSLRYSGTGRDDFK